MTTVSALLQSSFDFPPAEGLRWRLEDAPCAMCRQPAHYELESILSDATAELADTFRLASSAICDSCAACFAQPRALTSNLLVFNGVGIKPMVAQTSATQERPSWRDIVRTYAWGGETVAIVTSNTKRRLWPQAVVSSFARQWRPLFVDGDVARCLTVDVEALLTCLDFVEQIYNAGFAKGAIARSLFDGLNSKRFEEVQPDIFLWERRLQQWRPTDEFVLALFIAQKEQE